MTVGSPAIEIQPTTRDDTSLESLFAAESPAPAAAPDSPAREFLDRVGLIDKLTLLRELNEQFQTDNPQFQELFPIIEADAELLKRFVKMGNTGWFNSRVQIDSPYMVYTRFGTEGFYKLTLGAVLSHSIGELGTRFKVWPHLYRVARTGESLAAQIAPKLSHEIFSAGLLHDAVVPSMEKELTDYLYFLECAMNLDPVVTSLENNCHNFDHAQASGELASALGFTSTVVEAVTNHHRDSLTCVTDDSRSVLGLLLVTKRILHFRNTPRRNLFETPAEKRLLEELSNSLAISSAKVQRAVLDILEEVRLKDN